MPRLTEESYGTGDQSWIASTHAIYNCRSVAPDPTEFTAVAYPNGVPSGTPLSIVDDLAVPFDGTETLVGFLYTDQPAPGDGGWPLFWHGAVRVDRLPAAVIADIDTAAAVGNPYGQITFVDRPSVAPFPEPEAV